MEAPNKDYSQGEWWGADVKLTQEILKHHKIILGGEFTDNFKEEQLNYDEQLYQLHLNDERTSRS